jgi:membrane protein YdbS with pleckstrin-like domain
VSPSDEEDKPMRPGGEERVYLETRRHGIVLLRAFVRSFALLAAGIGLLLLGWPFSILGAALMVVAAFLAVFAVWRWDRTLVVVTTDKLFVVHGILRRRAAAVHLARVGAVEVEQSLLGRLLGYGTVCAGELEIDYVPAPREVYGLVAQLSG